MAIKFLGMHNEKAQKFALWLKENLINFQIEVSAFGWDIIILSPNNITLDFNNEDITIDNDIVINNADFITIEI